MCSLIAGATPATAALVGGEPSLDTTRQKHTDLPIPFGVGRGGGSDTTGQQHGGLPPSNVAMLDRTR